MENYIKELRRFDIEHAISKIPNKFYPSSCKTALIDCLIELELLSISGMEYGYGPPFAKFDGFSKLF